MDEEKIRELIAGFTTVNHFIRETWMKVFEKAKVSVNGERVNEETERGIQLQMLEEQMEKFDENRFHSATILMGGLRFVNNRSQPLRMMKKLELDPSLLEQPLYH